MNLWVKWKTVLTAFIYSSGSFPVNPRFVVCIESHASLLEKVPQIFLHGAARHIAD